MWTFDDENVLVLSSESSTGCGGGCGDDKSSFVPNSDISSGCGGSGCG